jgi:hypothetical protein
VISCKTLLAGPGKSAYKRVTQGEETFIIKLEKTHRKVEALFCLAG